MANCSTKIESPPKFIRSAISILPKLAPKGIPVCHIRPNDPPNVMKIIQVWKWPWRLAPLWCLLVTISQKGEACGFDAETSPTTTPILPSANELGQRAFGEIHPHNLLKGTF
jgi:hypothetical protein